MIKFDLKLLALASSEPGVNTSGVDAIRAMGAYAGVLPIYYNELYLALGKAGMESRILESIDSHHVDAVYILGDITYTFDTDFLKKVREKAFVVLNYGDDELFFDILCRYYAQAADLVVTFDYSSSLRYKQLGIDAWFTACPFDSQAYPYAKEPKDIDLSFVGAVKGYPSRERVLRYLSAQGVDVLAPGWLAEESRILFEAMRDIFARTKINLNFTGVFADGFLTRGQKILNRVRQIKGRPFEIALTGSFVLTEYAHGIEHFFEIGREIDTFASPEELLEKVRYYLRHEDEREEIARRGYERVIQDHEAHVFAQRVLRLVAEGRAKPRRLEEEIWLDDIFLRNYSAYRLRYVVRFLRARAWRCVLEELAAMWRSGGLSFRVGYWYFREEVKTILCEYPRVKRLVKALRDWLRGHPAGDPRTGRRKVAWKRALP